MIRAGDVDNAFFLSIGLKFRSEPAGRQSPWRKLLASVHKPDVRQTSVCRQKFDKLKLVEHQTDPSLFTLHCLRAPMLRDTIEPPFIRSIRKHRLTCYILLSPVFRTGSDHEQI
jgi:hypothetical protein